MSSVKNERLLKALLRQPVDLTPVWIMRQAGRYLPEYRAIRRRAGDFLSLCKTPELACEVTLQPLSRFDLDAAILFSDILTVPDAMGTKLYFQQGEGPCFQRPIRSKADLDSLGDPDPEIELRYVMDTIRLVRRELAGQVPLIGFAGSPWTLACYMVEGKGGSDFRNVRKRLYQDQTFMHQLLIKLTQVITRYLQAQICAGVQVIMIFDTWGGLLTTTAYQAFSLHYISKIIASLKANVASACVPIIVFTKQGGGWLELIADSGCDAISLDWTIDIRKARQRVGQQVTLQGNLDPLVLNATPARIREEVEVILASYGSGTGHIFNLGHGINPDVDPENVACLIDAVHELSAKYHPL